MNYGICWAGKDPSGVASVALGRRDTCRRHLKEPSNWDSLVGSLRRNWSTNVASEGCSTQIGTHALSHCYHQMTLIFICFQVLKELCHVLARTVIIILSFHYWVVFSAALLSCNAHFQNSDLRQWRETLIAATLDLDGLRESESLPEWFGATDPTLKIPVWLRAQLRVKLLSLDNRQSSRERIRGLCLWRHTHTHTQSNTKKCTLIQTGMNSRYRHFPCTQ